MSWLVVEPAAEDEGIYRQVASFESEEEAQDFAESNGEWLVIDASEMDVS